MVNAKLMKSTVHVTESILLRRQARTLFSLILRSLSLSMASVRILRMLPLNMVKTVEIR